ncbi:MAG: ThuA domain-containing protein [Bacteroidota bacterium]
MRKFLRIFIFSLITLVVLGAIGIGLFIYKAKYGFPIYETEAPPLPENLDGFSVLVFSKTNGFNHGDAIEASLPSLEKMAKDNKWSMFQTNSGAVFRIDYLAEFDVVVWNNVSGPVLNAEQRSAFKSYIESGGGFVGIHAAGDDSHQWKWYEDELIGAHFSHHPLDPHFQESNLILESDSNNVFLGMGLQPDWKLTEEWYVFYDNPRLNGKTVLYNLNEDGLVMSGNLGFLIKDKNYGMGEDHPMAWYGTVGEGRSFYSALGHSGETFNDKNHLQLLRNAILWAGKAR